MTKSEFFEGGVAISREAKVIDGAHSYFFGAYPRLHRSCQLFQLFTTALGDVLEIGPYYGYTPFFLRAKATSYTVLEGDDPMVHALVPLYERRDIALRFVDLFDLFGPIHSAPHRLPLPDERYNTILCWETMEHFNFNPVKFVREMHRLLKPGGTIYITVPNTASFQSLFALLSGRGETEHVDTCYQVEDYQSNGKTAYYGLHWHEYTRGELAYLFRKAGFAIRGCNTFVAFYNHSRTSAARKIERAAVRTLAPFLTRFGTNVYLIAEKQAD